MVTRNLWICPSCEAPSKGYIFDCGKSRHLNMYMPIDYHNHHNFHSILLQGVCDHRKRYLGVCCNMLGGTHDATHLRKSSLWCKLKIGELMNRPICQVEEREVTPYLLGDSTYPIRPWLLKSYQKKSRICITK